MMNKFHFLFLLLIGQNCFAQKMEDLKVFNHFSVHKGDTFIEGELAPYGKKIHTHTQKNYAWFSGTQLHQTQGAYKDRLLNGKYLESYTNRQLSKKGKYKNGLKNGKWYTWNEEGTLLNENHYQGGLLSAYQVSFDSTGNPTKRIHYIRGFKNGLEQERQQNKWKTVAKYKNGQTVPLKPSLIKRTFHAVFKKHSKKD